MSTRAVPPGGAQVTLPYESFTQPCWATAGPAIASDRTNTVIRKHCPDMKLPLHEAMIRSCRPSGSEGVRKLVKHQLRAKAARPAFASMVTPSARPFQSILKHSPGRVPVGGRLLLRCGGSVRPRWPAGRSQASCETGFGGLCGGSRVRVAHWQRLPKARMRVPMAPDFLSFAHARSAPTGELEP